MKGIANTPVALVAWPKQGAKKEKLDGDFTADGTLAAKMQKSAKLGVNLLTAKNGCDGKGNLADLDIGASSETKGMNTSGATNQ